jgi:molecular chaperone DnaK
VRYQYEDIKRKVSKQLDSVGGDSQTTEIKTEFFGAKAEAERLINEHGNDLQKAEFRRIIAQEKEILATNNQRAIKNLISQLDSLSWKINQKNPTYLIFLFFYYKDIESRGYKDVASAKRYVDNGEKALERKNYDELLVAIYSLYNLLPPEAKAKEEYKIKGTGLG